MEKSKIKKICEAVLYTAGDPVSFEDLANLFEITADEMKDIALEMQRERNENECGILVKIVGDGIQFCTNNIYSKFVDEILVPKRTYSLSQSAIETLSIIAYKQPITKAEIENIRGIKCDYSVSALVDKGLVYVSGKKETIGRPNLYSTSDEFLRHFNIENLSELPQIDIKDEESEE